MKYFYHRYLFRFLPLIVALIGSSTAFAQDKGYDVTSYNINLQIDRQHNYLNGVVTMTAKVTGGMPSVLQHCIALTIDSVFFGNIKCTTSVPDSNGAYYVSGYPVADPGGSFILTTYYHGNPSNEGGSMPWGGVTNNGKMMFSMGVGFSAPFVSCTRYWLPCYDLPDDKADSVTLNFITPDSDIVASNGLKASDIVYPANHVRATQWKVSHPIASYLITFATGGFIEQDIPNPLGIPFECFSYQSDSVKTATEMNKRVVESLVFFDSLYGHYPFEKVGYVIAPIGSMEHQTMITLINTALDTILSSGAGTAGTTAPHELSHMWWGDRVTCKDFNDPWLNEGFATFSESLILERFSSETAYWARQHANISGAISGGSTNAMYGAPYRTSPRDNYPYQVIYQKGASVLGMLRYMLGDSVFFQALRDYGNAHAYANATSYDLESDLEKSAGLDLHYFFNEWVFGIWYPQIKVNWSKNASSYTVNFNQTQDLTKYQLFRMPLVIEARTKGGLKERATVLMDSLVTSSATVSCSFVPDTIVIDPDGAVIKKIVGNITLGTTVDGSIGDVDLQYNVRFIPNPSTRSLVTLAINVLPFEHGNLYTEDYYRNERLAQLDGTKAQLDLFDSGGRIVLQTLLPQAEIIYPAGNFEQFNYALDLHLLSSGTYFAKVLLENQIVGEGQLVITK